MTNIRSVEVRLFNVPLAEVLVDANYFEELDAQLR